jgi:hypothetical protein
MLNPSLPAKAAGPAGKSSSRSAAGTARARVATPPQERGHLLHGVGQRSGQIDARHRQRLAQPLQADVGRTARTLSPTNVTSARMLSALSALLLARTAHGLPR